MKLSYEINILEQHIDAMQKIINSLKDRLRNIDRSWPDHQVIPFCDWHDRSEIPPEGKIWASDGINVWLINSDGKGIGESATSVKFWSIAFIPHPPDDVL